MLHTYSAYRFSDDLHFISLHILLSPVHRKPPQKPPIPVFSRSVLISILPSASFFRSHPQWYAVPDGTSARLASCDGKWSEEREGVRGGLTGRRVVTGEEGHGRGNKERIGRRLGRGVWHLRDRGGAVAVGGRPNEELHIKLYIQL